MSNVHLLCLAFFLVKIYLLPHLLFVMAEMNFSYIFSLWQEGDSVVAHFEYHTHPITSIEWSPHEASTLAVSSSDNQLT